MTEQENFNNNVQMKLSIHDEKFDAFMREMQSFRNEMKDFKDEMRQQNQIRAEEMREMREENNKIREEIRGIGRYVQSLSITAMIGIGAMVITVIFAR